MRWAPERQLTRINNIQTVCEISHSASNEQSMNMDRLVLLLLSHENTANAQITFYELQTDKQWKR